MVIISGGAKGVDTSFASLGYNTIIVSFDGHDVVIPNNECILFNVPDSTFERIDYLYNEICKRLNKGRAGKDYIRKLLKRDILQILNPVLVPDIVVAVADIDFINNQVIGGTGYAVEVAKMYNVDIVVLNKSDSKYYIWEDEMFKLLDRYISLDKLKSITGIGSREISDSINLKISNDVVVFRTITNDIHCTDEYVVKSSIWSKSDIIVDEDNTNIINKNKDSLKLKKAIEEFKIVAGFEFNKLAVIDNILNMNYIRLFNIILKRYFGDDK